MTISKKHESPMERARRKTQEAVDAGLIHAWVLDRENGAFTRDRLNAAKDRRANFRVLAGGRDGRRLA